jgi:hypothetical protein
MKLSKNQITKLQSILEKSGFHLDWNITDNMISVGKIVFHAVKSPDDFSNLSDNNGVIIDNISRELRSSLQAKNISYIDPSGYLFISNNLCRIIVDQRTKLQHKKEKKLASTSSINPTLLISPNGLAIIEAIFKTTDENLKKYPSTLQFCKTYELFQPKVSKIMTTLGVKNLIDLKKCLKKFSVDWWIFALESSLTKRKMTPFFEISQSYYSMEPKIQSLSNEQILTQLSSKYKNKVSDGPTQVAVQSGDLIDSDLTLWVDQSIGVQIKRDYKLVAGTKEGFKRWILAFPPQVLEKSDIISHFKQPKDNPYKTNVFRSIWDLGFSEARLKEIRNSLLRSFLK